MKRFQFYLIIFICALSILIDIQIIEIAKQTKEIKELKMTIDNVENQIKLLTPPPESFMLPEVKSK